MIMNPYLRHAQTFGNIAMLTSAAAGCCIGIHTHSGLLAAACSLAFLTLFSAQAAACCYIVARLSPPQDEAIMDHHKVAMPEPRHETGDRFAGSSQRFTTSGYCLTELLAAMALLTGVLLFIPLIAFIVTAVFGAQEPRW